MRLAVLILFILLFSFIVVASPASDASDCGNNLRCVYRVTAKTGSIDSCADLEGDQKTSCYKFLEAQNPEVSVKEQVKLKEKQPELRDSLILAFSIIIVLVMVIILYLLFQRKKLKNE